MSADDAARHDELARTVGPRVLGYLIRRTDDPDDAADLLQTVLLTAWRRRRDLPEDPDAVVAWFFGCARRCLANHRRGSVRRSEATAALARNLPGDHVDPDLSEEVLALRAAVADLPDPLREVVELVYWDDLTTDQAARTLGVAPATVRKRLQRARDVLRSSLGQQAVASG